MEKDKKEKIKQAATLAGAAVLGGSTAEAAILLNATADEIQEPIPTPPIPEPAPPVPEPVPPVPEPVPPVPEPVNPDEPQPQGDDPDPTGLLEPITIVVPDDIESLRKGYLDAIDNYEYYVKRGIENSKRFSIDNIVRQYKVVYKKIKS